MMEWSTTADAIGAAFFASVIAVVEAFHYRVGRSDTHRVEACGVWNDCCGGVAGNDRLDHCFVAKPRSGSFPSTGNQRAFAAVRHRIVAQSNFARDWRHPASRLKCNCPQVGSIKRRSAAQSYLARLDCPDRGL